MPSDDNFMHCKFSRRNIFNLKLSHDDFHSAYNVLINATPKFYLSINVQNWVFLTHKLGLDCR